MRRDCTCKDVRMYVCACACALCRVHQRLYKQAVDLRHKQEAKRRQAAQDVAASMTMQRSSMSWISQVSDTHTHTHRLTYSVVHNKVSTVRASCAAVLHLLRFCPQRREHKTSESFMCVCLCLCLCVHRR